MMKFIAVVLALIGTASPSLATTLTYDDIGNAGTVTGPGFTELGYQFSSNMVVIDISTSSPWPFHALSGNYAALNDYGGDAVITQVGGGTFSFINTYLKGWNTEMYGPSAVHAPRAALIDPDLLQSKALGNAPNCQEMTIGSPISTRSI